MKGNILIVDDELELRSMLAELLRTEYEVNEANNAAELKEAMSRSQPDIVLLDLGLPDGNGLDLLPEIKRQWGNTEVIVLTGMASIEAAVTATKRGAYHFLNKPVEAQNLLVTVARALEHKQQHEENTTLRRALSTISGSASPVFQSAVMQAVVRTVERVAPSDVPILITGESGSGKEVIADLIHAMSPRSKGKIIKINCAAIPRELIEGELFGSKRGGYTGAVDRDGYFRQADGGTLFLDEISEMPIDIQSKLLRILQDQEVRPVGSTVSYKTNCRLVAATNRKTEEAIKDNKLREDLFYRISAISVHLPPLRERREDIMPLCNTFLKRFVAQSNRPIRGFSKSAVDRLSAFDWPGNVRQVQNEIQRAVLMCETSEIDASDLSITNSSNRADTELGMDTNFTLLEGVERNEIMRMLKETGGNKLETAKRLGIGRQTLYNKIKAYAIEV